MDAVIDRHPARDIKREVFFIHPAGGVTLVAPAKFSSHQTSIGIRAAVTTPDGTEGTLRLPEGDFPLVPFLDANLPSVLSNHTLVVWIVGATPRPRNIGAFPGKKVLIVGDTHYLDTLQRALEYAASEPFDIVFMGNRHHGHWFKERLGREVYWIHGIVTEAQWREIQPVKQSPLVLVGHLNKTHKRRRALLKEIKNRGYPLDMVVCPPEKLAKIYSLALLSLNISLNGDANFRFIEVPAAGGFLLTDRISDLAGVHLYYDEGFHYAAFDSVDELCANLDRFLADPAEVLKIAQRAQARCAEMLTREMVVARFWSIVDSGEQDPIFNFDHEPRYARTARRTAADLEAHVAVYLQVQELQRRCERPDVLLLPGASAHLALDCADLNRTKIWHLEDDTASIAECVACSYDKHLHSISREMAGRRHWNMIIGADDLLPAVSTDDFILMGANALTTAAKITVGRAETLAGGVVRISLGGESQ